MKKIIIVITVILIIPILILLLLFFTNIGRVYTRLFNYNIHLATIWGEINDIDKFIRNGVSVNSKDQQGATPLMLASFNLQVDVVKFLLSNKADVNSKDLFGNTPLLWLLSAEERYHSFTSNEINLKMPIIASLLIKNGAKVNIVSKEFGNTPLLKACEHGYYDVVKILVSNGAYINYPGKGFDNESWTPLMIASKIDNFELAKLLITFGANVSYTNKNNESALSIAKKNNNIKIIKLLKLHYNNK